ncbi:MAG: YggT family protein, partial [Gammaproteobacteria bacterium]|nr:YggT family protein [Gammaproteobacteria bacterium]
MSGGPYVGNAGVFLVQTLFGLYILAVMLRLLFQLVRADFYNPVSQFLVQITNPPLKPLRRVIPGWAGIDLAAVLLLVALQLVEHLAIGAIVGHQPGLAALLVISIADLISLLLYVYLFAILILVILSWVSPGAHNPVVGVLYRLTEPVMRPARQLVPPISGIDLSPLLVIIVLQLLQYLLVAPLRDIARSLAVG